VIDLPCDTAAECGALGCVLCADNGQSEEFLDQLIETHFHDIRNLEVFRMLLGLQLAEEPLDIVSLVQRLKDTKRMGAAGGLPYVQSLPDQTPSPINFPTFLSVVKDRAARRKLLLEASALQARALDTSSPMVEMTRPVCGTPIGQLTFPEKDDPAELLRHRFLCRRMSLLFVGSTGKGKSSWLLQALALWANGLSCFGIAPVRPLTSIYVQAENDDGDIASIRDGICKGLEFDEAQRAAFFSKVLVYTETALTGKRFCEEILRRLLEFHRGTDLLTIDPALSYLGGDSKEQRDVGAFLRNYLNPILFDFDCAAILNHHTNKTSANTPSARKGIPEQDFAYYGTGSAEWANWARAILALEGTRTKGIFRLHAAKRGQKIGWKDQENKVLYSKLIAHSKTAETIYWRDPDPEENPSAAGRDQTFDELELLSLLEDKALSTKEWATAAEDEFGVKERTFFRAKKYLEKDGRVLRSKTNKKWFLVTDRQQNFPGE
jgi:hypothetical protein